MMKGMHTTGDFVPHHSELVFFNSLAARCAALLYLMMVEFTASASGQSS